MSTRNRQPARRSSPAVRPMAVPIEPPKKSAGCGSIGVGVLLLALVLVVLLMMMGILPNPLEAQPTATSRPVGITDEPTGMIEITPTQGVTSTLTHTSEPIATNTPEPTLTFTPTPTEKPMPFVIRGTPSANPNGMLFPQYSCEEYLFIGGEVLDLREAPVFDLTVKLGGTYGGSLVDLTSVSGDVTVYGESGFGFAIENKRIRESGITIQLFDENGEALSALTYLSITGNCDSNLVIVNYKQVREIQP
ncbi:MAG TPA: hypothetical protein PKY64_06220 [Anaerolineaceae bacterium]|nr:hypothetical protein [Anaerolineaceae bacterium]